MKTETEEQLLENSEVRLIVTIPESEVKQQYDELVKEYCEKVAIKGFRKGKAPAQILIRKLGDSLKTETTQNLVTKSLQEVLEKVEHKPLPYCVPALKEGEDLELDLGKSFSFEVTFDTFPTVELGQYKGLAVEEPDVRIAKEDMDRELAAIQDQNAIVVDKTGGAAEKGDTVTIDYVELDESGGEIDNSRREGFTFELGSGYNLYGIDDDILGMVKDHDKVVAKEYAKDYRYEELAGRSARLRVKLTGLKQKQLPEIDDELAQDISDKYKTLADLKAEIRKRLDETINKQLRETNIRKVLEKIVNASKVPFPKSMAERELDARWQNFTRQFQSDEKLVDQFLSQQGRSREDLYEEWRPMVESALKSRLVENELGEQEKIQVTDDEVDRHIEQESERAGREVKDVKSEYVRNNLLEMVKENIKTNKIYDFLLENTTIGKGEKANFLDFIEGNR